MELEKQVINLSQAKRLKELGVKMISLLYFEWNQDKRLHNLRYVNSPNYLVEENDYSAFTAAELGAMLANVRYESFGFPLMFTSYSYNYDEMHNVFGKWSCNYRNPRNFTNPDIKAENEADARAQMLIYLLESGIIKAEEVK